MELKAAPNDFFLLSVTTMAASAWHSERLRQDTMSTSGSSRLSRSMSGSSNGSLLPPPSPTAQTASHTVSAWQPIATQAHTNTHPHCHQSLMRRVAYKFGDKTAILGDRESWEKRSGMSLKNANSQIERIAMRSPTYGECFAG